jgi:hypothetical protein
VNQFVGEVEHEAVGENTARAHFVIFFVLGSTLILFPHYLLWRWDYGITSEIGAAFVIAAILGFTVDRWLKAELRTDAFLAAIGHILEPEFRAEVSRIVGYKIICEGHSQWVEITLVENNVVRVTTSVERTLRNKSKDHWAPGKTYQ